MFFKMIPHTPHLTLSLSGILCYSHSFSVQSGRLEIRLFSIWLSHSEYKMLEPNWWLGKNTFYKFILHLARMHRIFCHSIHCSNLLLFHGNQHNAIGAPPTSWKQKNSLISCIIGPIYGKTTINSMKKMQFIADLVHHDKNRCCVVF